MGGPTGIGWHLKAGGVITRFAQSLPDENANGYCGSNNIGSRASGSYDTAYFNKIINETWDAQPDRFYFSFLNFSGVFELDPNGNPVLQSSYGLKIVYCPFNRTTGRMAGGNEDWIIQDMAGNNYYFGDGATETSNVTIHGQSRNKTQNYISSWYISKIVTADNQTINFQYQSYSSLSYSNYSDTYVPPITLSGQCSTTNHSSATWNENTDITIAAPIYLSKITSSIFEIDFKYDNSPMLGEIDALQNGVTEKIYRFGYTGFLPDQGFELRLGLSSIQEQSVADNTSIYLYGFSYNTSVNLPQRNSIQTDLWGYYNSNPGSSDIQGYLGGDKTPDPVRTAANILVAAYNAYGGSTKFTYEQNDWNNNSSNSTALTGGLRIKNISSYSSDGTQIANDNYTYNDPNTGFSSGQLNANAGNYSLPVDYLLTDGINYCLASDVFYYSASFSSLYDLANIDVGYSYVTVTKADGSSMRYKYTNFSDYPDVFNKKSFYNNTQNDASSINVTPQFLPTSYAFARGKMLTEEDMDISHNVVKKITNTYSLSSPIGDVIGINAFVQRLINGVAIYYLNCRYDFSTQDLLLMSKVETSNFYNSGILSGSAAVTENYTYVNYAGNNLSASKTRTLSNGNVEKTTYRYPFNVLTTIPTTTVDWSMPISYMVQNNIIGQPVEVVKTVINGSSGAETVQSVSLTRFAPTISTLVKPSSQYRLKTIGLLKSNYTNYSVTPGTSSETEVVDNTNLEQTQLFTWFSPKGNLTDVNNPYTGTDGQTTNLWGYDQNYLIATAKNATYGEIYYNSFEETTGGSIVSGSAHTGSNYYSGSPYMVGWSAPDSKSYVISYWYRSSGVWKFSGVIPYTGSSMSLSVGDAYDDVYIHPVDALMTAYTYEPMVGLTSSEDSKGQTIVYEYDGYKRLLNVKDLNGNIVKSYDYNHKIYQSNATAQTYQKQGCPLGYNGSSVTYSVQPGAHTSTLSQDDANNQASEDLKAHGQTYANNNGSCSQTYTYVNFTLINGTGISGYQANFSGYANLSFAFSNTNAPQTVQVPIGTYTIAINPVGDYTTNHTFMLTGQPNVVAPGTAFNNVAISDGYMTLEIH